MASKVRKKKDLPTINYAKVDLESFRKNFYTEPAELAEMTDAELGRVLTNRILARCLPISAFLAWRPCSRHARQVRVGSFTSF